MSQFTVPLSHLVANKHNPRRVKPAREAHKRLVALIKAYGLIHPLPVRPVEGKPGYFQLIAGDRRLSALKEIHRNNGDPKIACTLRKVDQAAADALSLAENVDREPMHPLDEAEAFAKLAKEDGKSADVIAADFGLEERYIRQRMKLSTLAKPIKAAYRENAIDTATAEVFCSIPEDRQLQVWKEVNGKPQHASHVRNIIASSWIDASLATFDVSTLPPSSVSQDLFAEKVLVERQVFMEAQANALLARQEAMKEEGWSDVVIGRRQDLIDKLLSMDPIRKEFTPDTAKTLTKIAANRAKLETAARNLDEDDEVRLERLQERFEALETEREEIEASAPVSFSEKTKAVGTAFLIVDADGRVQTEYRKPRPKRESPATSTAGADGDASGAEPDVPTADDLSDRQMATTFTHQALLVREALLKNDKARRRVLAMLLSEKVPSEALSIRHNVNGTTLHASAGNTFKSAAFDRMRERAAKIDPFAKAHHVTDVEAYRKLGSLSDDRIDSLIDLLVVQCLTAHLQRRTELVEVLARELKVNVRDDWRPDTDWLGSYQKLQLAGLITTLRGEVHAPAAERKKSELVEQLAKLFGDAADGKLDDKKLADTVNAWQPSNLRGETKIR